MVKDYKNKKYLEFVDVAESNGWTVQGYPKTGNGETSKALLVTITPIVEYEIDITVKVGKDETYPQAFIRTVNEIDWIVETVIHYTYLAPYEEKDLNEIRVYRDVIAYKEKLEKTKRDMKKVI